MVSWLNLLSEDEVESDVGDGIIISVTLWSRPFEDIGDGIILFMTF